MENGQVKRQLYALHAKMPDDIGSFTYDGLVYCGGCGISDAIKPLLGPVNILPGPRNMIWFYRCQLCREVKAIATYIEPIIDEILLNEFFRPETSPLFGPFADARNVVQFALQDEFRLLNARKFALTRKLATFNNSHLATNLGKVYRNELREITERLSHLTGTVNGYSHEMFEADLLNTAEMTKDILSLGVKRKVLRPLVKKIALFNDEFEVHLAQQKKPLFE